MNEIEALAIIENHLLSENSILVKMRCREGLDEIAHTELLEAMKYLTEIYKNSTLVPRRLALAFVDVSNFFFINESLYSIDDLKRMEIAAQEILELANILFD